MALVSVLSLANEVGSLVVKAVRSSGSRIKQLVLGAVEAVAQAAASVRDAVVLFVAARSFVQRIVRRERLHVTPGWRLCPSI